MLRAVSELELLDRTKMPEMKQKPLKFGPRYPRKNHVRLLAFILVCFTIYNVVINRTASFGPQNWRHHLDVRSIGRNFHAAAPGAKDSTQIFAELPTRSTSEADACYNKNQGNPEAISACLPEFIDIPFEVITAEDKLDGWEDEWVAHGVLPSVESTQPLLPDFKIDVVVTWVNGTPEAFQEVRDKFAVNSILNIPGTTWLREMTTRHRDWGQVQWAVMSGFKNVEHLGKVQLVVGHGQTTDWPDVTANERQQLQEQVEIVPVDSLFSPHSRPFAIPTFNSIPIETHLGNTKSEADAFIYLNDDIACVKPFRASDIYTPLYGLTLTLADSLVWNSDDVYPPFDLLRPYQGEFDEYAFSSWHLNRAFGRRNRAYVRHATRVMSRRLLKEVTSAFPRAYWETALSRFRGDRSVINPHFHALHYLIERHRKALLWSYLQRMDTDGDGFISVDEKAGIVHDLMSTEKKFKPRRTMRHMTMTLQSVGLNSTNAVRPRWSSFDGPSYSWFQETKLLQHPVYHGERQKVEDRPSIHHTCEIDYSRCFDDLFDKRTDPRPNQQTFREDSVDLLLMLDHISRRAPSCGDCMINKLVRASGAKGLSRFLPPETSPKRDVAVKAIMRYTYTKAKLPGVMFALDVQGIPYDLGELGSDLGSNQAASNTTLAAVICVNDAVPEDASENDIQGIQSDLTRLYRGFLEPRDSIVGHD